MEGQRVAHGALEQPRLDRIREQRCPQRASIHDMVDLATGKFARPPRHYPLPPRSAQPYAAILTRTALRGR